MTALVLLEVGGIQRFIFASVRLREQVGASRVVAKALAPAVTDLVGPPIGAGEVLEVSAVRDALAGDGPLVILLTSGKALVRMPDEPAGAALVREVTRRALVDAPGLEVVGVTVPADDGIAPAIGRAHRELERARAEMAGPAARFPHVPPVAHCASSGLPAATERAPLGASSRPPEEQAAPTVVKEDSSREALRELQEKLTGVAGVTVPSNIGELDRMQGENVSWLGVVHADGDGIGDRFISLLTDETLDDASVVARYLMLSRALVDLSDTALRDAAAAIGADADADPIPVLPLVAGGDDLTVLLPGSLAVAFGRAYSDALRARSSGDSEHPESRMYYWIETDDDRAFVASVGIAIVKPKYPFHHAYELAESALELAKRRRRETGGVDGPAAAGMLDVHVEFGVGLEPLPESRRRRRTLDGKVDLHAGPWAIEPAAAEAAEPLRTVDGLLGRISALEASGLSRSVTARLRDAVVRGPEHVRAFLDNTRQRDREAVEAVLDPGAGGDADHESPSSDVIDAYELVAVNRETRW